MKKPSRTRRDTLAQRFWAKVERTEGCWLWRASHLTTGYGQIWVEKRNIAAHRVAYELTYGPVPEGKCVLHSCDNRSCVRPEHLFVGTKKDNTQDMLRKGRNAQEQPKLRGERNASARLTEAQVREIRRRYANELVTSDMLATEYGVSDVAVQNIINRKTWRHLPPLPEEKLRRSKTAKVAVRGEGSPQAKLTNAQRTELRRRYAEGTTSTRRLAAEYNVSQRTIWRIVTKADE